jgi:hypothetical protein
LTELFNSIDPKRKWQVDHGMRQIGEVLVGSRKVRLTFLSILTPNLASSNAGHRGVGISIERA